ncbi:hypothetical protein LTR66_006927 [Elasticomyces elasticus]|nr:hypothetical protein LTR66_006927 [Elasticomyces elasticus]
MTTRYTDAEWASIIHQTENSLVVKETPYPCPAIGSSAFAKTIDHTLLKLQATAMQIDALCAEARVAGFATVCVRPNFVSRAVSNLKGSDIKVDAVVGFPEGTQDLYQKMEETSLALSSGASELDIVLNYPLLHTHSYSAIYTELASLRSQAPHPTLLKLILETSQLSRGEIIAACSIAAVANFDFVKTSTGFLGQGATEKNVRLMRAVCDRIAPAIGALEGDARRNAMRVKASGGIKTLDEAVGMLEAGAGRLGTSGGVWIVKEGMERAQRSFGAPGAGEEVERPGLQTRLFTDY